MAIAAHLPVAKVGQFLGFDYRSRIKAAVLNELQRLHRRNGSYCQFVGLHEREFVGGDLADIYVRLLGQSPGLLIRVGDAQLTPFTLARTRFLARVELEIGVYTNHLGSREARAGGDTASLDGTSDPGSDRIVSDVRGILVGRDLLAGVQPLANLDERILIDADEGTVWLLGGTVRAYVRPAQIPPEGTRPDADSIQTESTIPTAVPRDETKVTTLATKESA